MKKNLKETLKIYISNIVLVLGLLLLSIFNFVYPMDRIEDIIYYASCLFLIYASLTFITYVLIRKRGDYELLYLTVTNVIIAVFLFLSRNETPNVVLGVSFVSFLFQSLGIKLNKITFSKAKKEDKYIVNLITTIIFVLFTLIIITIAFFGTLKETFLFGLCFLIYALIWFIEIPLDKKYLNKSVKNSKTKKASK